MIMQDKDLFTYLPSDNPKVPAAEFPFRHHQPVQMRFTDIDMLGHLNNNVYLTFMDLAKVEYFAAVLPEGMDWRSINAVVVHIACDFYAPSYSKFSYRTDKVCRPHSNGRIRPEDSHRTRYRPHMGCCR